MQPSEELPWVLKAELCRVRKTFRDLAEDLGVGQTYLSMVVHGQKRAYDVIDAIGRWLYVRGLNASYVVALAFYDREDRLSSPEARWRLARYYAKLWAEEQEHKLEAKDAVYD